jgi:hypothetical protein
MAADLTLSLLDEKILLLADHMSPEEISRELGGVISPARVRLRKDELVKSHTWLERADEDFIVTWKLRRVLAKLEGQHFDLDNAKVQLSFLKAIGDRLDKRKAASEAELNALYGNQARIMGRAIDMALSYMKGALRGAVDPELWDEALKEGLYHAQAELDRHQAVEQ